MCSSSAASSTGARSKIRKLRKHLLGEGSSRTSLALAPVSEMGDDGPSGSSPYDGDCSSGGEEAGTSRVQPVVTADRAALDSLLLQRLAQMQVGGEAISIRMVSLLRLEIGPDVRSGQLPKGLHIFNIILVHIPNALLSIAAHSQKCVNNRYKISTLSHVPPLVGSRTCLPSPVLTPRPPTYFPAV